MGQFDNYLAKNNNGVTIGMVPHTQMVLHTAMALADRFNFKSFKYGKDYNLIFKRILASACILHDIGKFASDFQNVIRSKKTKEEFIKHNIISFSFACKYINEIRDKEEEKLFSNVNKSILFHHYFNYNDSKYDSVNDILLKYKDDIPTMISFYKFMSIYVNEIYGISPAAIDEENTLLDDIEISKQTVFEHIPNINDTIAWRKLSICSAMGKIVSALLIYADRLVSKDINNQDRYLLNDTNFIINEYNKQQTVNKTINPDFSDYNISRLSEQKNVIDKISQSNINTHIIPASAGAGKTLMGLMYFINTKHKLLWNVPTTNLAVSAYNSIIEELKKLKMDNVTVGLMYNGTLQEPKDSNAAYEDFDIIVSVIDTFLSYHHKNNMRSILINAYDRDIIFDEYHEFITNEPLFALFNQIMYTRCNFSNNGARSILLSATPKNFNRYWGVDDEKVNVWNNAISIRGENIKVHVKFITGDIPVIRNSISYIGTVNDAQNVYLKNNKFGLLLHANYTDEDKQERYNTIFKIHGKENKGDNNKIPIITTNMIGIGWDVSVQTINDVLLSPDHTIQRVGRSGRFDDYDDVYYNVCELDNPGPFKKIISFSYNDLLNKKWKDVLKKYDNKVITKKELYNLYDEFYRDNKEEYQNYLDTQYNDSCKKLTSMKFKRGCINNDTTYLSNDETYRGLSDSVFVTVKTDNGYLDPLIVREKFVNPDYDNGRSEQSSTENNKTRYEFITNYKNDNISFPSKYTLKNKPYYIKEKNDASVEKCLDMAKNSKMPCLLCDFIYDDLGLHHKSIKN